MRNVIDEVVRDSCCASQWSSSHVAHVNHLRLLQVLDEAHAAKEVKAYHFALLRQVLENISSFLGVGQFGYVLQQIGISDAEEVATIVN